MMCGFVGFWDLTNKQNNEKMLESLKPMADRIRSRGPDGEGYWSDEVSGIALAHRRLAILDLSDAGHQPMHSSSGKNVIIYNGEIYNGKELRSELESFGIKFKGNSDTEVLLEGCEKWGVEITISRCIGMFAFALWNREKSTLSLVRDRLGIKPLYWGKQNNSWYFASQPKAITAHPEFKRVIDRTTMRRFIQFAYVPSPDSIFEDLKQLRPGHLVHIQANGATKTIRYWDLPSIALTASKRISTTPYSEQVEKLRNLLSDAVKMRMISDVPLGGFLSGGIDSSTIIALMQAQSTRPIKTFSIGFNESTLNEAEYAKSIAQHLGTDHTEMYVSDKQILELVPNLAEAYDEPFADSSQLPTQILCNITSNSVTVALSGDGGDELFSGYNRYLLADRLRKLHKGSPAVLRKAFAKVLTSLSPASWDKLARFMPKRYRYSMFGDKLHKLADVINKENFSSVYPALLSYWKVDQQVVNNEEKIDEPVGWKEGRGIFSDEVSNMQLMDTLSYMPDDILSKVDRVSMSIGLEVRVPIIDHRIVEFAFNLPHSAKIKKGVGKRILRDVLYKYVPKELMDRPKMGFGVPLDDWLRGPLRDWAESLLEPGRLNQDEMFSVNLVRDRWNEHLSGKRNWQYSLWNVLMAQSWRERWSI